MVDELEMSDFFITVDISTHHILYPYALHELAV